MTYRSLLATISVASTLLSACGGTEERPAFSSKPVPVEIAKAGTGAPATAFDAAGQAEAVQNALISTRMMGSIQKIYVDIGDHVRKGQLLFSIHAADIQAKGGQVNANIAAAEAALANAQKDYERFSTLFKQNSATAKELDNVTLQYKAAKAQLEAAKQMRNEVNANMSYASVTAPFDGVITQKMMDEGALASPGMPVLGLEQPGALQFTATVSESDINHIEVGDAVSIYVAAIDKTINGKVKRLSESSSASGGRFPIQITPETNPEGLRSGMFATITFSDVKTGENSNSTGVLVPESALMQSHELTGIYTVSEKGTALLRWVRTGRKSAGLIEIISGLSDGEQYISKAGGRLYNGAPVKVN
jgi:RND family efflux transporter MFP subunit